MTPYYDDNFGFYSIESEDDIDFFHYVQKNSVEKQCSVCGKTVKLMPQYDKCNRCMEIFESGGDPYD